MRSALHRERSAPTRIHTHVHNSAPCAGRDLTPLLHAGCADKTAKLWRLSGEYAAECVATLAGHPEELYCCDWLRRDAEGQHRDKFVTASGSVVSLWDVGAAEPRREGELKLASTNVFSTPPLVCVCASYSVITGRGVIDACVRIIRAPPAHR